MTPTVAVEEREILQSQVVAPGAVIVCKIPESTNLHVYLHLTAVVSKNEAFKKKHGSRDSSTNFNHHTSIENALEVFLGVLGEIVDQYQAGSL